MFEFIKLVMIIGIPVLLIYTHRHLTALMWLAISMPLDALSSTVVVRVTCLSAFGIAAAPFVLHEFKKHTAKLSKTEALILLSCVLMAAGMLVFGWLYPWPDFTGERPLNQLSQGRSVIFTTRYIFDFMVPLYVGYVVWKKRHNCNVMNYLLVGTTVVALSMFLQLATGVDLFYHLSTFLARDMTDLGRARGLCFEPRVAAQWCVVGILLCIGLRSLGRSRLPLAFLHLGALAATLSTSGLVLLGVGVATMATMMARARKALAALACALCVLVIVANTVPVVRAYRDVYYAMIEMRLRLESAGEEPTFYARIKDRLEVFDYAAVGFFEANPEYLLFGTGPGLISIPGSSYLRYRDQITWGGRIDAIPFGGLVQTVSNLGLAGLLIWLVLVNKCRLATLALYRRSGDFQWKESYILLVTFSVFYLFMVREMWFLALGLGIGAALILRDVRRGSITASDDREQPV